MRKLNLSDRGVWDPDTDAYVNFVDVQDYMVYGKSVAYVSFRLRTCRWEAVFSMLNVDRAHFVTEEAAKKYVEREWARSWRTNANRVDTGS